MKNTLACAPEAMEALEKFTHRFAPAGSVAEATHSYSTPELLRAIGTLLPGFPLPPSEAIIDYLQVRGYRFDIMPGQFSLEYKWLLAER